ncbi:unnamed protein product [Heterosigma akashiwo]
MRKIPNGRRLFCLVLVLINACASVHAFQIPPLNKGVKTRRGHVSLQVLKDPPKTEKEIASANKDAPAAALEAQGYIDSWEGRQEGFDWELEKARRVVFGESVAYSPLRMDFWKPLPDDQKEKEVTFFDTFYIIYTNIAQFFFGGKSMDGAPVAEIQPYTGSLPNFIVKALSGSLEELAGGPLFLLVEKYYKQYGPVFKLAFGPRSFIVVSDPVMAKHILRKNPSATKGVLADILEEVMGKGLIPADPATWKVRRKAIVPGFHARWLDAMAQLFVECNLEMRRTLDRAAASKETLDMETMFCSVSLDIIGRAVFNYKFNSVTKESPVVKCVYATLKEAEHRSTSFVPYWKIPFVKDMLPSQVEFKKNMKILNDILDELIVLAYETSVKGDVEELEQREMGEDPSLLRFLVDMRGEDASGKQLRDDLMTMLIAGHETTAAVLTWCLFNLAQQPEALAAVRGGGHGAGRRPEPHHPRLAGPQAGAHGADRGPAAVPGAAAAHPPRPGAGHAAPGGRRPGDPAAEGHGRVHLDLEPAPQPGLLGAPGEVRSHPVGAAVREPGRQRLGGLQPGSGVGLYPGRSRRLSPSCPLGRQPKCAGDQFAMMESCVTLAMLLQRYDFAFDDRGPGHVGMRTGATIHTENGLNMRVSLSAGA